MRIRAKHLVTVLVVVGCALWLVFLRPVALGGPASYIFVSGASMLPTLESGDLVLMQRRDAYADGDVIAFRIPQGEPGAGSLVIHRIVGGSPEDGFVTQGDNKERPDDWRPTPDEIEGASWVVVPGAGTVIATIRTPPVLASLAASLVVFFIVLGGPDRTTRPGRRRESVGVE